MKKIMYFFVIVMFSSTISLFASKTGDSVKVCKSDSTSSGAYSKLDANQIFELERAKIEALHPEIMRIPPFAPVIMIFPFTAAVLLVLLFLLFGYFNKKKRYILYAKFIENGKDIPMELLDPKKEKTSNLKKGMLWLFFGLGFVLTLMIPSFHHKLWTIGFIPIFVGIGYLLVHWLENKPTQTNEPS